VLAREPDEIGSGLARSRMGHRGCDDSCMDVTASAARVGVVRVAAGWVACALAVSLTALTIALTLADGRSLLGGDLALGCVLAVSNGLLGAFILTRFPGHRIGWLFAVAGLSRAVAVAADAWCVRALVTQPGSLPFGAFASWLQAWMAFPAIATAPMIVVLFPDGRLPGRIWRVVPALTLIVLLLFAVVVPIGMWPYRGMRLLPDAPVPDTPDARAVITVITIAAGLAVLAVVLALASVLMRARRAAGELRQQVKWFGYGAGCGLVLNMAGLLPGMAWIRVLGAVAVLTGIGLGIFRYRLYDVDRLINRTLVYGIVSVALVGGFAALDITLASILGRGSVVVAAASAFVVALLLRPARDRVQDLVDRVFDRRTYDAVRVLRALGQRVGQEPVEPHSVVAALQRALRDPGLLVFFYTRHPDGLVDADGRRVDQLPTGAGQVAHPVTRAGHTVALLLHAAADPALLRAVTRAAALVLEHARLQAELLVQLAEVRASRARLVAASDTERRRIERDLHDGAQQRLVGLALHVQSAKRRSTYPPQVVDLLAFTVEQLHVGVEEIRALVHGISPPALVAGGLPAAMAELARPGEVSVACRVPERLDPGIEATAWFVACEGVANAAKHAPGHQVEVDVSTLDERLMVRVSDSGPGGANPDGDGLRNLADRVEAHGGSLSIHSPAGAGTRMVAELPCGS
jgi:signal transduction histidine kinase